MSRLPIVNFKTMEKVLLSLGFIPIRQKGSHVFYRHSDGRTTTSVKPSWKGHFSLFNQRNSS